MSDSQKTSSLATFPSFLFFICATLAFPEKKGEKEKRTSSTWKGGRRRMSFSQCSVEVVVVGRGSMRSFSYPLLLLSFSPLFRGRKKFGFFLKKNQFFWVLHLRFKYFRVKNVSFGCTYYIISCYIPCLGTPLPTTTWRLWPPLPVLQKRCLYFILHIRRIIMMLRPSHFAKTSNYAKTFPSFCKDTDGGKGRKGNYDHFSSLLFS